MKNNFHYITRLSCQIRAITQFTRTKIRKKYFFCQSILFTPHQNRIFHCLIIQSILIDSNGSSFLLFKPHFSENAPHIFSQHQT